MKRIIYGVCSLIILTFFMIIYVQKNYDESIMEINLSEYISPKEIVDIIDETEIYDYVIVCDLFSNEESAKVYAGNLNILINDRIKDSLGIALNGHEVIMGDRFAKKNYNYYPLGEKHITKYGEYRINGIIKNSGDIYYNDLKILEDSQIKNQRLYVVLKNKDNKAIDENTLVSQLSSWGISNPVVLNYGNVKKFLIKILIVLIMILIIIVLVKQYKILKKSVYEMMKKFNEVKYDLYFRQFITKRYNFADIKNIIISLTFMTLSAYFISFLTVKFVCLKMPYKLNPVSPKSINDAIKLFTGLIRYYVQNGMTEVSTVIVSLAVVYFIALAVIILYSLRCHA